MEPVQLTNDPCAGCVFLGAYCTTSLVRRLAVDPSIRRMGFECADKTT
jgi:hypothetical protein